MNSFHHSIIPLLTQFTVVHFPLLQFAFTRIATLTNDPKSSRFDLHCDNKADRTAASRTSAVAVEAMMAVVVETIAVTVESIAAVEAIQTCQQRTELPSRFHLAHLSADVVWMETNLRRRYFHPLSFSPMSLANLLALAGPLLSTVCAF